MILFSFFGSPLGLIQRALKTRVEIPERIEPVLLADPFELWEAFYGLNGFEPNLAAVRCCFYSWFPDLLASRTN